MKAQAKYYDENLYENSDNRGRSNNQLITY